MEDNLLAYFYISIIEFKLTMANYFFQNGKQLACIFLYIYYGIQINHGELFFQINQRFATNFNGILYAVYPASDAATNGT